MDYEREQERLLWLLEEIDAEEDYVDDESDKRCGRNMYLTRKFENDALILLTHLPNAKSPEECEELFFLLKF